MNDLTVPAAVVWQVGALCRAVSDALQARFNPVSVQGEVAGFSRAASGHCYFSLKDDSGQLRCAMFKRAAVALDFNPSDGEKVEVDARLAVYEPRGDLQLVVERMRRAGQGSLFEQFVRLKNKLQAEGLFDAARKRALPAMPRAIGLVTSLNAAALHDVVSTLRRRVPHLAVLLVPASVQGLQAPAELMRALELLYGLAGEGARVKRAERMPVVDVIMLVRGGGAMEDLWAFNNEELVRLLARSPVPLVCGIGHETDFTLADFVADLRAPTPTAAAELVAQAREDRLLELERLQLRLDASLQRQLDRHSQRLDGLAQRLGRPSARLAQQRQRCAALAQTLQLTVRHALSQQRQRLDRLEGQLPMVLQRGVQVQSQRLAQAGLRLSLLDPQRVLLRGYAWLSDKQGQPVVLRSQAKPGQSLRATLSDGTVDLTVDDSPA